MILANGVEIIDSKWIPDNFIAVKLPESYLMLDLRDIKNITQFKIPLGINLTTPLSYPIK